MESKLFMKFLRTSNIFTEKNYSKNILKYLYIEDYTKELALKPNHGSVWKIPIILKYEASFLLPLA